MSESVALPSHKLRFVAEATFQPARRPSEGLRGSGGSRGYCRGRDRFQDGGFSVWLGRLIQQSRFLDGCGQMSKHHLDIFRASQSRQFACTAVKLWPEVVEVGGPLGFRECPEVSQTIDGSWLATCARWLANAAVTVERRAAGVWHGRKSEDGSGTRSSMQNRSGWLNGGANRSRA